MAYKYISRKQKKSYLGWKIFIGLTLVTAGTVKAYLWAYDTTLSQEINKVTDKASSAVSEKIDETNQAAKLKARELIKSGAKEIGIDLPDEKTNTNIDLEKPQSSSSEKMDKVRNNNKYIDPKDVQNEIDRLKITKAPSSLPTSLPKYN